MTRNAGVWIDHRDANMFFDEPSAHDVLTIQSNVEGHQERHAAADDRKQMARTGHLDAYYDRVIAALVNVSSVLILGPGEAKGELQKRLTHARSAVKVAAVIAADKMTQPQFVAAVRKHFAQSGTGP